MNKCVWIAFACVALPLFASKKDPAFTEALINGALTKIEFHVTDDDGLPVADAKVRALLGMRFRPLGQWVEGLTDTNGVFVLEGKTCGDEIEVFITKQGYYDSHEKYCFIAMGAEHEVEDGKWQPYGAVKNLPLRKIKNPVRLLSSYYGKCDFKIMVTNVVLGFDMELGDFVEPYGSGKTPDICVEFTSDGLQPLVTMHSRLTLTFPDPLGAAYAVPICKQSNFKWPYAADVSRFSTNSIVLENRRIDGRNQWSEIGQESILVIRSRCKLNDAGEIVSAHYGTIHKLSFSVSFREPGCLRICYNLNPTSNDTNLEPLYERPSLRKKNPLRMGLTSERDE